MRTKSMVLILIAAVCGLVASIGISQMLETGPVAAPVLTEKVFVAAMDLDTNTKLNETHVRLEEWPKDRVPEGAVTKIEELKDHFVNSNFVKGDIIFKSKISAEQNGAAGKIPEGFRSIALRVSVSDNMALIKPGDRVDVLLFVRKGPDVPFTMTRTILTNVRVYAVGGEITRTVDKDGKAMNAQTVSVLVFPDQVQKLMLATELGRIQLSLRGTNETDTESRPADTVIKDLFADLSTNADPEDGSTPPQSNPSVPAFSNPTVPAQTQEPGFTNYLKQLKPSFTTGASPSQLGPAAEQEQAWTMEIHTPDGIKYLRWNSMNEPAQEISRESVTNRGGYTAPAPAMDPRSLIGQPIDLQGKLLQGGTFDLQSYRGSPVVISLWATWCPACMKELPVLKGMYDTYSLRGLKMVHVNLDKDPEAAAKAVTNQQIQSPVLFGAENNLWAEKMGIKNIPTILLVSADGRLTGVANQVSSVISQVESALAPIAKPKDEDGNSEPVIAPILDSNSGTSGNENTGFSPKSADEKKTGSSFGSGASSPPSSTTKTSKQRVQRNLK